MVKWLLSLLLVTPLLAQTPAGGIRGNVFDKDLAVPLGNVWVTIEELRLRTSTTTEGNFVFEQVQPGTYTLSFSKDGYQRQILPPVTVQAGSLAEVRCELSFEVNDLEEFIVRPLETSTGTELGLLEVRQEAPALSDAISADFIKKSGASTAASALKLVVGTSVQDGKYVVIRGLSDRYTVTQLNGVRLPTADAEKRAVQLDQFPGAMIESITVSKTFTPDQQGDATGGSVNIKTRAVPEELILSVSGAVEYNTQTTGRDDFLTYRGGGAPASGMSDRGLPAGVSKERFPNYAGPTTDPLQGAERLPNAQYIDALTESFAPVMGTSQTSVGPNYSGGFTVGDKHLVADEIALGWIGGFSYRRKYQAYPDSQFNIVNGTRAGEPLNTTYRFKETRGQDEVLWAAVAGLGLEIGKDHSVALNYSRTQTANDQAVLQVGAEGPNSIRVNQALRYQERLADSLQLRGDHKFTGFHDIVVDWSVARSTTTQDEPDFRAFRESIDTRFDFHTIPGSQFDYPRRVFRTIEETSDQALFNVAIPFTQWTETEGKIKFGPFVDITDRDLQQDSFFYNFAPQAGSGQVVGNNAALLNYSGPGYYADVFLRPHRVGLATNGAPALNQLLWYLEHPQGIDADYTGRQEINAVYLMAELPLTSKLKLIGGVRVEKTDLQIDVTADIITVPQIGPDGDTFFVDLPGNSLSTQIESTDYLPALGLHYEVITNLFVRAAYSQTIARPTFRELAPLRSYDFIGGDVFIGNSALQLSHIENYDLRAEWFRRPGDVLAASVFYKDIQDPIEQITFDVSGGDRYSQRVNYPDGKLYGIEGEWRQQLDIFHEALADFTFGMNASYIISSVTLPDSERERLQAAGINKKTRPMLGQPDFLINANLVYDNKNSGTSVGLFYTRTGDALISGESRTGVYIPNLYELGSDNLDFSVEQKLGKNWRVTFRAKNLTDPAIERAYRVSWQNKVAIRSSSTKGMDFSLGATYTW
ncbi:MAG: hypothetical protein PCFJNLEI_01409 [Verrucomicrobiae bacterium]|nr:hypothetical protein [Verrucomicrobiae bacterium]